MSNYPKVAVGVISCRNPDGLLKCLTALLSSRNDKNISIMVVDNDDQLEALAVLEGIRASFPSANILGFHEKRSGIPYARNRLMREALKLKFDFLLMLDDDEYPSANWLTDMLQKAISSKADVIGAPVKPKFLNPPSEPIRAIDFSKRGGRIVRGSCNVESTANILFNRRIISHYEEKWFSELFSQTGGSDTEFLRRTLKDGFKHELAHNAIVYEDIPESRTSEAWHKRRSFRLGNGLARTRMLERGVFLGSTIEIFNLAGLTLKISFYGSAGMLNKRSKFRSQLYLERLRGKIAALRGTFYNEYSRENYR